LVNRSISEGTRGGGFGKVDAPHNRSIEYVGREEGISIASLYLRRSQAPCTDPVAESGGGAPEDWGARDKFATIAGCAALNETKLSEYWRSRKLYPDQIRLWRGACEQANDWAHASERELRHYERALAKAVALLTMSKKSRAIGGGA
jgi:hypothetical protein